MITIVLCVSGWLAGWVLLGRPRSVADLRNTAGATTEGPGFDIVIPARDEAEVVGLLLSDLTRSARPGTRIVVVDDHSSDGTAEVAASFPEVEVVSAPELEEGWTGKSWACHHGVAALGNAGAAVVRPGDRSGPGVGEAGRGLVFLDADVRLGTSAVTGPEVLELLVRRQQATGGLVSVQPWHETLLPYERLSALFNVIAIMGTAMSSRRGPTGAFGPVLVTSRAAYRRAGGHESVAAEVVEDLAIADRYRSEGMAVDLFEGGPDVRFRMYPNGLAQLVEGWTKNFATGAGSTRPLRLLGAVLWIAGLGSGAAALLDGLRGEFPLWAGIGLYLAFVLQLRRMFRQVGRFGTVAEFVYPVLVVFFVAVFLRSVWSSQVRHSVRWRGRAIAVGVRRA